MGNQQSSIFNGDRKGLGAFDGDHFATLGIPCPDGRPLFSYRLTDDQAERANGYLSGAANRLARWTTWECALFVIWAADWWRRNYRGGPRAWEAIERALGVAYPHAVWRALTDNGLNACGRRPIIQSGMALRLTTLAVEGGFPSGTLSKNSWAYRLLEAVVQDLLNDRRGRDEVALHIVIQHDHLIPVAWRNEATFRLCADVAISILEARTGADAASVDQGKIDWLDENRPDWRTNLPLRLETNEDYRFLDQLLTIESRSVESEISISRVLARPEGVWESGIRLQFDGLWTPSPNASSIDEYQRALIYPTGQLSTVCGAPVAVVESDQSGTWPCRRAIKRDVVFNVPLSCECEFEVRSEAKVLDRFIARGGYALGFPSVFCPLNPEDETWIQIGTLSGSYVDDQIIVALPPGWTITAPFAGDIASAAGIVGPFSLWDVRGGCVVVGPDGDRSRIMCGKAEELSPDILPFGAPVVGIKALRAGEGVFAGSPTFHVSEAGRLRPVRSGELAVREAGRGQPWRPLNQKLEEGYFDVALVDPAEGLVRSCLRVTVLPGATVSARWREGRVDLRSSSVRLSLAQDAVVSTVQGEGRATRRRTIRGELTFDLVKQPVFIAVDGEPFIADADGSPIARGRKLGLGELSKFTICARFGDLLNCELRDRLDQRIKGAKFRWRLSGDCSLATIKREAERLFDSVPDIDGELELYFDGVGEHACRITRFGAALRKGRGRLFPSVSEANLVGRSMLQSAVEVDYGAVTEDVMSSGFSLPTDCEGPWLVYLRNHSAVVSRPEILGGRPIANRPSGLAAASAPFARDIRLQLIGQMYDQIETCAGSAFTLLSEVRRLSCSLNNLPAATFDALQLLASRPRVLCLMALTASEEELPYIFGLADLLPFSWSVLPSDDWNSATDGVARHLFEELGAYSSAAVVVGSEVSTRRGAIVRLEPCLAPALGVSVPTTTLAAASRKLLARSADHIENLGHDPFAFARKLLPAWDFDDQYHWVLNAPCVAALAALRNCATDPYALRLVRSVRHDYPEFFSQAYQAFYRGDRNVH